MIRMTASALKSTIVGLVCGCRILRHLQLLLVALSFAAVWAGNALADVQLGNMSCTRISGTGFNLLIYSKTQVRCTFKGRVDAEQSARQRARLRHGNTDRTGSTKYNLGLSE